MSEGKPLPVPKWQSHFLKLLVRFVENRTARKAGRSVIALLEWMPGFRKPVRTLRVLGEVDELEREEKFDEARALRSRALRETEDSHAAALWRSEGSDLLYRLKDYRAALDAFEHAIQSLETSPAMYGVALPDHVYYGAAVAAVMVGDKAKAARHSEQFEEALRSYRSNPDLRESDYVQRQAESLEWLRAHLTNSTGQRTRAGGPRA